MTETVLLLAILGIGTGVILLGLGTLSWFDYRTGTARVFIGLGLFVVVASLVGAAHAQVPERAWAHKGYAFAVWRDALGLDAPTATLAGQIHQESAWRTDVSSPFAHGLAQFTRSTATDMARLNPDLRPADTGDPRWSLRAQAYYMQRLVARHQGADEAWLMALAGYNSGPGWTDRSIRVCRAQWNCAGCDERRWAGHVEHALDPRHAAWAVQENRHYVRAIVTRHGPAYERAGWGRAVAIPAAWLD